MTLVLAYFVGGMRTMNKELAQYINTLLAEKERGVEREQKQYNSIYNDPEARSSVDAERMVVWGQELSWERSIIYRCQKAMDYFEEEY